MVDDKAITEFARKEQPMQPAKIAGASTTEEKVMVKPVRTFKGVEGFKNPESAPFEVSRRRAAELFANGLVEYVSEDDEKKEIEASVKEAADKRKRDREASKLKDSDKTTPLKNPTLPGVEK